ncbi:hypothetical protein B0T25DRAFT_317845 [Lasiosphaeria hispida]|uniref:Uncharacterized protein n=1 Tax=Lasiosphaeria hispida TaxID=260671 RepID=A0AAJ0H978_9PEZI|nr:hypothetical protein B0T25DRAFT_317845 [Lasiosphaeria hispida]
MGQSVFFSSALFGVTVQALVYPGTRETDAVAIPPDAQSPRPTIPPALHRFLRRQSYDEQTFLVAPDNTCGYVSAQKAAAYTCVETSAYCVFVTASGGGGTGVAGCCDKDVCGFRIDCLDYAQISTSSLCDAQCMSDSFTEKCTESSMRYCNTIEFPGGITDYFCHSLIGSTAQLADTTYLGQEGRTFSPLVFTDTVTRPTRTRADTESTTLPPLSTNTSDIPRSSSPTPVGAIVGGVVGGIAVLGLVCLGIFYIIRHKKPKTPPAPPAPAPGPAPETTQYNLPPPTQPGMPHETGAYDTSALKPGHQSTISAYSVAPSMPSPQQQYQSPQRQSGYSYGYGGHESVSPVPSYNHPQQSYPEQPYPQQSYHQHHVSMQSVGGQSFGPGGMSPPPQHGMAQYGQPGTVLPGVYEAGGEGYVPGRPMELDGGQVRPAHELA